MTSEDCLNEALHQERIARDCGVHDPAYQHLMGTARWYLEEAARLELEEIYRATGRLVLR